MFATYALEMLKRPFKTILNIKGALEEVNKKLTTNNQMLKDVLNALIQEYMSEEEIQKLALKIKNMH